MDCVFCKIIKGEVASYKVFEDELVVAFLDKKPLSKGHTLIVPKKHSVTIADIDDASLAGVCFVAKYLANLYTKKLHAQGFNLRNSSGTVAHQDVFHFHLHLIPRYDDDELNLIAKHSKKKIDISEVHDLITCDSKKPA